MASAFFCIKEEDVMCPICFECWKNKDARMLSCQHTFCVDCLSKLPMEDSDIICPTCRQSIYIPDRNVNKLQRNLIKSALFEFRDDKLTCDKHKKEGSFYCQTHDVENICSVCFDTDHADCSIITMTKKYQSEMEAQKKISIYVEEQDKLIKDLELKEKSDILVVQTKYTNIKTEIAEKYEMKKKQFLRDLKNGININDAFDESKTDLKFNSSFTINYELINSSVNAMAAKKLKSSSKGGNSLTDVLELCKILKLQDLISVEENKENGEWMFENSLTSTSHFYYVLRKDTKSENISIQLKLKDLPKNTEILVKLISKNDLSNAVILLKTFTIKDCTITLKNKISSDDLSTLLNPLFASSNHIESLSLCYFALTDENCTEIKTLLNQSTQLRKFTIITNFYVDISWSKLFPVSPLSSFYPITEISFPFCNFDEGDCNHLGNMIGNCSVKKVKFHANKNMKKGVIEIFKSILKCKNTIKYIEFSRCNLIASHCMELAKVLNNCSKLETVNLSENENMVNGFSEITNALVRSSKNLKHLEFYNCSLTNEQCQELCKLIKKCKKIETIDLSHNKNCLNSMDNIFDVLKQSRNSLRGINFNYCNLSLSDKFLKFFTKCSYLQSIHLSANRFEYKYFEQFCESLDNLKNTLQVLVIRKCGLTSPNLTCLFQRIQFFSKIKVLILNENLKVNYVIDDLLKSIIQMQDNLEELHLKECEVTNDHKTKLEKSLSTKLYF